MGLLNLVVLSQRWNGRVKADASSSQLQDSDRAKSNCVYATAATAGHTSRHRSCHQSSDSKMTVFLLMQCFALSLQNVQCGITRKSFLLQKERWSSFQITLFFTLWEKEAVKLQPTIHRFIPLVSTFVSLACVDWFHQQWVANNRN